MKTFKNYFSVLSLLFCISGTVTFAMEADIVGLEMPVDKPALSDDHYQWIVAMLRGNTVSKAQKEGIYDLLCPASIPQKRIRIEPKKDGSDEEAKPEVNSKPVGSVHISPIKPKAQNGIGQAIRNFSVYAIIAHRKGERSLAPPHEERLNFAELLRDEITDKNLFEALAEIEVWVRKQIKKNPALYNLTAYVGLAQSMTSRFSGHSSDLKPVERIAQTSPILCQYAANRKERYFGELFTIGYDATMSALVYNIPKEYLPVVEVLVGLQFNVLNKGTSILGDGEAWKKVQEYNLSEVREKALINADVQDFIEQLEYETFKTMLTIGH